MKRTIDAKLDNLHHIVIGQSGAGKTTWLKRRPEVKKARRLIAWDPDHEYELTRYTSPKAFLAAVRKAGDGPLRIALSVDATPANFDWFCAVLWAIAGVERPTLVIIEECADVTRVAKAAPAWGRLIRRSRKYGMVLYVTTQRPAECDKTIYSQCAYRWVGFTETPADQQRAAQAVNRPIEEVIALQKLEFFYKTPSGTEKKQLSFKK